MKNTNVVMPPEPLISSPWVGAVRPSAPLTAYVDHYWFSEVTTAPETVLIPDGRVDVVLECTSSQARVSAYGSVTARTVLAITPKARYVGIQFRPGSARHFLAVPTHELTDHMVAGHDALRVSLAHALDTVEPLTMISRIDAALVQHLHRVQPTQSRIDSIVTTLEQTHGTIRIDALTTQFGISRRQIERDFLDAVGLSPKSFAAILRFRHAAERLRLGEPIAQVAFAAGYADQSHLNREVRRFADLTPVAYARGDVAFLQDSKRPIGDTHESPNLEQLPS